MPQLENQNAPRATDTAEKEKKPPRPVQISKEDNEWNKRALEIAARELRLPKTPAAK